MTKECNDPTCVCCHPERQHYCDIPPNGGACPKCGREWVLKPFEEWPAVMKKHAERMPIGPLFTSRTRLR